MAPVIGIKNISFGLMHFASFIACPCETNLHFFKCQSFLQRLLVSYISFLGHDCNKPSPEELFAIIFPEQLPKRELMVSSLGERTRSW